MAAKEGRSFLFAVLPSVGALLILLAGFALGRYYTIRPLQKQIVGSAKGERLGQLISPEKISELAPAYENETAAATGLHGYTYSVPDVPTPFVGSAPRPGQTGNVFINSMQFRSTKEVTMPKPAGVCRIFLTGGSVIFGSGAPDQESIIAAYLERRLNADLSRETHATYEVFTMANQAWTSTQERIIIENRLSELAPDLVISFSGLNDVHWAGAGRDVFWFRTYADQNFFDLLNATRKLAGFPSMPDVIPNPRPVPPEEVAARLEKNVRLSAAALVLKGSRYVFILQPVIVTTTKQLSPREQAIRQRFPASAATNFIDCYKVMRARLPVIQQDGYSYIDQSDVFASLTAKEEIFLDAYHFADRGNKFVADAITEAIRPQLIGRK